MRYLFGFMCVLALGLVGCGETAGTGGFPCTEQGIRDAIAEGGGPYTFACNGPTTVVTEAEIVINNDVILDGKGNLAVDGGEGRVHCVFSVAEGITAELRGFTVTKGFVGGIQNSGTLTVTNSTVSDNSADFEGGGTYNFGTLTLTNSTVSGNSASDGGGIVNHSDATLTLTSSIVDGNCVNSAPLLSSGYNVESPGDTCGFDQTGDQASVSAVLLGLQPLASNGGPTQTHAITTGSAAFNAGTCEVDEDQRGVTRPQGPACDVGAFELEQ